MSILGNLENFAFEGISFPATSAKSDEGHDGAEHTAYGRRGADCEPTGLQAIRGTFTIACFDGLDAPWGNVWSDRREDIKRAFREHPIGKLTHPLHGTFDAFIRSWPEQIDPNSQSGSTITVTFVEHNASASVVSSTRSNVSASAAAADAAMAAIGG